MLSPSAALLVGVVVLLATNASLRVMARRRDEDRGDAAEVLCWMAAMGSVVLLSASSLEAHRALRRALWKWRGARCDCAAK